MNLDQIGGLMRILIAAGVTMAAQKGWIPMVDKETVSADLIALSAIVISAVWSHIKHATVPIILAIVYLVSCGDTRAADLALKSSSAPPTICSIANCSGFYGYAGIGGQGTNVDILGSGLSGSVFANGMEMAGGGGYQYWNGQFFVAVEAGGGYMIPAAGQAVPISNRLSGETLIHAGVGLSNLFGSPASPTTFDKLAANIISPYGIIGARYKSFGPGVATGAGIQYSLGGNWTISAEYIHVNYDKTDPASGLVVNTDNLVRLKFEKHNLF